MSRQSERVPTASVVIPVHNAAAVIADQLDALCAQVDVEDLQVITVLNRCSDRSEDVIRSFADRLDITIVTADRLASAAYARNSGAAAASSSYVLFCDADDRVSATWARDLVEGLLTADFVGGRILVDRSGLPDWAYRSFYSDKDAGLLVREGRIPYPISACMGIHTSALSAVNGFDETFTGASGEETDLAIRLLRAGFRVGFVDGAVLHYRPRTGFRELSRQQRTRAFSNCRLSMREGVEIARPTVAGWAYSTARRLGRRVIIEKTLHPLVLASDVVLCSSRFAAARWASTATEPLYDHDPEVLDRVVELGMPLVGGLAFRTDRSSAKPDSVDNEVQHTTLALLTHLLTPGDVVVDVDAAIGIVAVAAALIVKPTGRVIALEADARTRELLRSNLTRHGCQHVEVPDTVTSDSNGSTVGLGRAATLDRHRDGAAPARESDERQPEYDDIDGVLAREPDAIVVARIGPPASDRGAHQLVIGLRASGMNTWVVEPWRNGTVAHVRMLEPGPADESNGAVAAQAGTVIAVPADRRDEMVMAVERLRPRIDSQSQLDSTESQSRRKLARD